VAKLPQLPHLRYDGLVRWIMIDWSQCRDVERIPGKVSGQWIVRDTRILADGVIENADDSTPEEIDEMFPGLGAERARRIIEYARRHASQPHPVG
jgi:uncharacterized protein (DUF433 family)